MNMKKIGAKFHLRPQVKYGFQCEGLHESRNRSPAWSESLIPNFTRIGQEMCNVKVDIYLRLLRLQSISRFSRNSKLFVQLYVEKP